MPANLTAEAKAKWKEAQLAKAPEDKIRALQEFLSLMPKHKGTENLRNQTKRKIAALKLEITAKKQKHAGVGSSLLSVERAGHGQIAVVGPPNSGKSSLLSLITNAKPLVAPYPFATQTLEPGMVLFEDFQLQLVEIPSLVEQAGQLSVRPLYVDFLRGVDAIVILVESSPEGPKDLRKVLAALQDLRITFARPESSVQIVKGVKGGSNQILVSGELTNCTAQDVLRLLDSYRQKNVLVRVFGRVGLDDIEEAVLENVAVYKRALIAVNKFDLYRGPAILQAAREVAPVGVEVVGISCLTGIGIRELPQKLFGLLDIIRVYTREPNDPAPSPDPFVVRRGTTTGELAKVIHSQLYEGYRFARVWGSSSKFPGERVGPSHVLEDKDVVEIHA